MVVSEIKIVGDRGMIAFAANSLDLLTMDLSEGDVVLYTGQTLAIFSSECLQILTRHGIIYTYHDPQKSNIWKR